MIVKKTIKIMDGIFARNIFLTRALRVPYCQVVIELKKEEDKNKCEESIINGIDRYFTNTTPISILKYSKYIEINSEIQKLFLKSGDDVTLWDCDISTRKGINDDCTPLGWHIVYEMIEEEENTIIKNKQSFGKWNEQVGEINESLILTGLILIQGLEEKNISTKGRNISLHGTNNEDDVGIKDSDGCIWLKNNDMKYLLQNISLGTIVIIH